MTQSHLVYIKGYLLYATREVSDEKISINSDAIIDD